MVRGTQALSYSLLCENSGQAYNKNSESKGTFIYIEYLSKIQSKIMGDQARVGGCEGPGSGK